jgi:hypothetical protein
VRFGRRCDGVGRGHHIFLLCFISFELVKGLKWSHLD